MRLMILFCLGVTGLLDFVCWLPTNDSHLEPLDEMRLRVASNYNHLEPLRTMRLGRRVYDIMQFGPILSRGLVPANVRANSGGHQRPAAYRMHAR